MPVTVTQIAKDSGVSQATVSQILNGKGAAFRPETRDRVLATATRLGYRPNTYARAMRRGSFGAIALLLPTNQGRAAPFMSLWWSIIAEAHRHDLRLTLATMPDEELTSEGHVPKILSELSADGMLIAYTHDMPERMSTLIDRFHIPSVWMNNRLSHDCVYPDDENGARGAVQYLVGMGHRRIAFFQNSGETHYSLVARAKGYTAAMSAAGLPPRPLIGDWSGDEARERMVRMLTAKDRPTAVITHGPSEGMIVTVAAAKAGLRIPEDLSLIVHAPNPIQDPTFRATRVAIPFERVGEEAVRMLIAKIAAPKRKRPPLALPMPVEDGGTCTPPK